MHFPKNRRHELDYLIGNTGGIEDDELARKLLFNRYRGMGLVPEFTPIWNIGKMPVSWVSGCGDLEEHWLEYQTCLDFLRNLDGILGENNPFSQRGMRYVQRELFDRYASSGLIEKAA